MALVLSSAARLKPEIRLAEAVSIFEASLSSEQKSKLRNWRTQSLNTPPNTTDVMRFTAEMDRTRKSGSRCLGPRFTSFLSGVQQFAALGDVIIGGSQNIVACGIWSLVRMSILVRIQILCAEGKRTSSIYLRYAKGGSILGAEPFTDQSDRQF
jgi:hypothetical protein